MAINNLKPFRFWCQKVLPLVYDNSLSYYEVLCKINAKINEIIEVDNQQNLAIEKNTNDIEELQHEVEGLQGSLEDLSQTVENHGIAIERLGVDIDVLADNFAKEYSSLSTYNIGDVVMESNHLYVKTANTGEFEDDWTETTVAEIAKGIENKITNINESIHIINNTIESVGKEIAIPYDTLTSYSEGMYCSYLDEFYVCTGNTTGTFDRSKWDETDVGSELEKLNTGYNNLNVLLNTVSSKVETLRGIIAEPYNEETTYNEGDYCTDLEHLYKCNSNGTTGEFNPAKWDVTTVGAELIIAMNSGGGGGGDLNVPAWNNYTEYYLWDMVTHNGNLYIMTGDAVIGTFNPNDWTAITIDKMITNNQVLVNGIGSNNYDGVSGHAKGELCVHWNGTTEHLYEANTGTSGNWDSNDWDETDLLSKFIPLSRWLWSFGVETYDPTKVYNAGDLIINYTGRIEYCLENNVTGAYDVGKWEQTTIFKELAGIKNTLVNLNLYNGNVVDRYNTNVTEVI